MNSFGWTLRVPKEEQAGVVAPLRALLCEHLQLCAAAGCSCTVGGEVPPLCFETEVGSRHHLLLSEGPHWAIEIRCTQERVIISVETDGVAPPQEIQAMAVALLSLGYQLGLHNTTLERTSV